MPHEPDLSRDRRDIDANDMAEASPIKPTSDELAEATVTTRAAANHLPVWSRHPLSRVWGDMPDDEFDELITSIESYGQLDAIDLCEGAVLDGWHRYRACVSLGIAPMFVEVDPDDPAGYVIAKNMHRRHKQLNAGQRALKVIQSYEFRPHGDQAGATGLTLDDAAEKAGVSRSTFVMVQRVRRVGRDDEIDNGTKTASQIVEELRAANRIADGIKTPMRERKPRAPRNDVDEVNIPYVDWRSDLLVHLRSLSPSAFERLTASLLRVMGFEDVEVTGRPGDGGIDGVGVYRPSDLISFRTAFQCKRYQGSVGSPAVREFRGSFAGRSDRGIMITTGSFTSDAWIESSRDGVGTIDLIDGEALCDQLREYRLGVTVTERVVEDVSIDDSYFERLER